MEPLSANDPRVVGEFALRARLGAGGMGRVYLGFSPGGRAVAIKVVHPELARDAEFLRRFRQEVASARLVSGMYTAPVVGSGVDDDPPWLATAYVPGPPLADVVSLHGPLAENAVWRLAAGLADALRAVHGCGLVHRDLKPGNVLLAADGPHVIDFGISRAFEGTQLTSAGMVVGTPGYMSPEQAEGQPGGPAERRLLARLRARLRGDRQRAVRRRQRRLHPLPGGHRGAGPGRPPGRPRPGHHGLPEQGPGQADRAGAAHRDGLGPRAAAAEHDRRLLAGAAGQHHRRRPGPAPAHRGERHAGQSGPERGTWRPAGTGHAPRRRRLLRRAAAGRAWGHGAGGGRRPHGGGPRAARGRAVVSPPQYPASSTRPASSRPPGSSRRRGRGRRRVPAAAMPQAAVPQAWGAVRSASWPRPGCITEPRRGRSRPGRPGPRGRTPRPTLQAPSWPQQQPSSGGSWPGGGQPSGSGGASLPSGGTPLAQYAPGRRRPTKAELPPPVLGAARLMYLGAIVTALNMIFGTLVKTSYTTTATRRQHRAAHRARGASSRSRRGSASAQPRGPPTPPPRRPSTPPRWPADIGLVVGLAAFSASCAGW